MSSSRVWFFLCPYYLFEYNFSFLFKLIASPSHSLAVCPLKSVATILQLTTRVLKIRKRRWKGEFMFFQSSSRLLQVTNFFKCRRTLLKSNSQEAYPSSEGERKFRRRLCTSSVHREIRHFHVVVVQWRQRNVQKSVMHVQSCCFAN